jgi:hypothetical protein
MPTIYDNTNIANAVMGGSTSGSGSNNTNTNNNMAETSDNGMSGWGSAIAVVATGAVAGIWALGAANAAKKKIEGENGLQQQLAVLEANRQQVIDPTEGMSNPYENLGVATEAARFEAEQIDISLANTLDAVRQTGSGGATALAQAALAGKRGISASIQQQEMDNQKLKAQGTMQFNQLKAQGKEFKFDAQEDREMQQLNRMQANIDQQRQIQLGLQQAAFGAITSGITSGVGLLEPKE